MEMNVENTNENNNDNVVYQRKNGTTDETKERKTIKAGRCLYETVMKLFGCLAFLVWKFSISVRHTVGSSVVFVVATKIPMISVSFACMTSVCT